MHRVCGMQRVWCRYASTSKNTAVLMRAQFDIAKIVSQKAFYDDSLARRGSSQKIKDNLAYIIEQRARQLELEGQVNELRHERSKLGIRMKMWLKPEKKGEVIARLKEIKTELKPLESMHKELTENIFGCAGTLPNILDPGVPKDPENGEIVQYINCGSEQEAEAVQIEQDHKEIGERFGIMDFAQASRVSGSSWYYLIGDGALLEQALVQYSLRKARKAGYTMVIPPSIVRNDIIDACGFQPNDQNGEKQIYTLEDEDTALTGTAEIPLGALHSSSMVKLGDMPIKYVGVSRSYRAEAGAGGKDTKGLYRVHEFTKVELFHFTSTPKRARHELEEIRKFQADIIGELGLKAKVINMPTTDLGAPAMKKYDTEAWMPGRGNWGELTSCSNCGDYQLRRLGIRFDDGSDKLKHAQTLNGTCMAVPRVIVALVEQNYDAENDCIWIPPVLRPFMDNKDRIVPNKKN